MVGENQMSSSHTVPCSQATVLTVQLLESPVSCELPVKILYGVTLPFYIAQILVISECLVAMVIFQRHHTFENVLGRWTLQKALVGTQSNFSNWDILIHVNSFPLKLKSHFYKCKWTQEAEFQKFCPTFGQSPSPHHWDLKDRYTWPWTNSWASQFPPQDLAVWKMLVARQNSSDSLPRCYRFWCRKKIGCPEIGGWRMSLNEKCMKVTYTKL